MSDEIVDAVEVKKGIVTPTNIMVPEEKRKRISELDFPDVKLYVVDKDGKLSVSHDDEKNIDRAALAKAVEDFAPEKSQLDLIKEKPDKEITLSDLVFIFRQNGTL